MEGPVRALVLGRVPYGDHDLVVSFLSGEVGRFSAFAARPRSKKKGWNALLSPGNTTLLQFSPRRRGGMPGLAQVDLIADRSAALSDPAGLARAAYFLELASAATRDGVLAPSLARALEVALDAIDEPETSRWMELQTLRHLGVEPDPDHCARCGEGLVNGAGLDPQGLGLNCRRCLPSSRHYPRSLLDGLRAMGETVVPLGGVSDHDLGVMFGRLLRIQLGELKTVRVAAAVRRAPR